MEDITKRQIYLVVGVVCFIAFLFWIGSHLNFAVDNCKHDNEVREMFYYNTTCNNLDQSRYECQRINYTKVDTYCDEKYPGGDWI